MQKLHPNWSAMCPNSMQVFFLSEMAKISIGIAVRDRQWPNHLGNGIAACSCSVNSRTEVRLSAQRQDPFKLNWLISFLEVADHGTQTKVGAGSGRTQSSISRDIKHLNEWLGKELLTGGARQRLTKHGKAFLPVAKEAVDLLIKSRSAELSAESKASGSLRTVWLEAFVKTVECAGHSAAAVCLSWDQSSVTRYVHQLETWLGKTLLVGLVPPKLTDDGAEFFSSSKRVLHALAKSRTKAAINEEAPLSPAQLNEHVYRVSKLFYMKGPRPGTKAAAELGMSDVSLERARAEFVGLRKERRERAASTEGLKILYVTEEEARELIQPQPRISGKNIDMSGLMPKKK